MKVKVTLKPGCKEVLLDGFELREGDGAVSVDLTSKQIKALEDSEIVDIERPKKIKIKK